MSRDEAQQLILKYRSGTCTATEQAMLESWYTQLGQDHQVDIQEAELESIFTEVWAKLPLHETPAAAEVVPIKKANVKRLWIRWAAAAILLMGFIGITRLIINKERPASENLATNKDLVVPGGNKAALFLSDNSKIELSDQKLGIIARQSNIVIKKTGSGLIAYETAKSGKEAQGTNSIETPAGGQFQAVLPDGTKVWLNAASRISYPVNFSGLKERRVKLVGEAYFEVKHDAQKPFFVETGDQLTEDIGTAFNVNCYSNEPASKTTLVEGSVRVSPLNQDTSRRKVTLKGKIIKPGQQAVIHSGSGQVKVQPGNTDQVLDWKNEEFVFDHQTIEEIMREISRWYNVKVVYNKNVDLTQTFGGQVPRSTPIRQVLKGLEATGHIKFELKGRTITVSNPIKK
jgi:transmembrane sensor